MKIKHQYSGKSLLELREEFGTGEKGFWSDNTWWLDESFAKEKAPKEVYEINFERRLTSLTYDQQKEKLPKGFDFPHPAVLVEAILSHYKNTGERLIKDWWSRTSVRSSDGSFVLVGAFVSDGLDVNDGARDVTSSSLGVCPSRVVSRRIGKLDSSLDSLDFEILRVKINGKIYELK